MKFNYRLYALLGAILLFTNDIQSQATSSSDLAENADSYFNEIVDQLGIPGFAVAIVREDNVLISNGYGYTDYEKRIPATGQSAYYIASSTKSFTGLLSTILDAEGVIGLDDSLSNYFPDLVTKTGVDLNMVKIRDLITHTSGIENNPIAWRVAFTGDHHQTLLEDLMKYCDENESGYGNYQYTNVGYNIYAVLLEKVTGRSWKDWMQEKIFDPAGMDRTSAYISKAAKENWNLARPYLTFDGIDRIELEKQDNTMQSAGGLITSADDMASWLLLQLNEGSLNGSKVFPAEIMNASQQKWVEFDGSSRTFAPTHYGMGWEFGNYNSNNMIYHFGGFAGYASHVSFLPEQNLGVAIMINDGLIGSKLMNLIATGIYDFLLEEGGSQAFSTDDLEVFASKVAQYRQNIVDGIAKRNSRPWQMSKEFDEYSGQYISEQYGEIIIEGHSDGLRISHGNLSCDATAYTKDDAIRVELVPANGEVIQMNLDNDKVVGLTYDGVSFMKVD